MSSVQKQLSYSTGDTRGPNT